MIIELFGLTGAGKSTLARAMAVAGWGEVVKVLTKAELIYYNLLFFLTHPIKFVVLFFYIVGNSQQPGLFYLKFMNTFLLHNAKYQQAKKMKYAIVDQGFLQNILSVFERELTRQQLKNYLRYLCYPDVLLILEATEEIIASRLAERGYATRANMPAEYLANWQQVVKKNYDLLLANLDLLPTRSFRLSTEVNNSELLNKVKDILENHE